MPFLIDGHNLIAALPDIELDDPDDEAKLILKLRAWAGHERRKATIVFDGGVTGGLSRTLSGGGLEVVFAAREHTIADRIIMERLRRLRDAPNWTVVSSDHEVLDAARRAGARVLTSQEFAARLAPAPRAPHEKPERVAPAEVTEWLEVFHDAPEPPAPRREAPPRKARSRRRQGQLTIDKENPEQLPAEDLAAWQSVFPEPPSAPESPKRRESPRRHPQPAQHRPSEETDKDGELSAEDLALWQQLFGEG